jgi:hypothetical protein
MKEKRPSKTVRDVVKRIKRLMKRNAKLGDWKLE